MSESRREYEIRTGLPATPQRPAQRELTAYQIAKDNLEMRLIRMAAGQSPMVYVSAQHETY